MSNFEILRRAEPDTALPLFGQVSPLLARIYANRGLHDLTDVGRNLAALLPDRMMKGIDHAVTRLCRAVTERESILIIGDFDCDGATSTALALLALRRMGAAQVDYLVPNRFEYGYGLSPEIVEVAAQRNPRLLITVDNGISSNSGVDKAREYGIDVIVTDHHLPGAVLPEACAIVNPNQPGCDFLAKSTCGVGVIFYVMIALRRALSEAGWFTQGRVPPNLAELLDLVALGTVADVVPLEQNNRILVYQGLQRIRAGHARPGILALLEVAGRQRHKLVATDLGFAVAPRLNAAGRLEDISIGIECLLTDDEAQARALAQTLDQLNQERRGIEEEMQHQALELLDTLHLDTQAMPCGVCLYDESWHQGVIGILASRIKERMHRPVIAFAPGDAGELKGSARSIEGFHVRDGLDAIAAANPGLLRKFGGHAMAAGLTLDSAHYPRFVEAFDREVQRQLSSEQLCEVVYTDGALTAGDISLETAEMLREAGPWGHQFPEPLFDGEFALLQQRLVGQKHLKMVLMDPASGLAVDAIHFNADLACWPDDSVARVRVVYRLDVNEFRGQRSVQMIVDKLLPQ